MALTKETKIAQIEIHGDYKHICIVKDTFVKEDGVWRLKARTMTPMRMQSSKN